MDSSPFGLMTCCRHCLIDTIMRTIVACKMLLIYLLQTFSWKWQSGLFLWSASAMAMQFVTIVLVGIKWGLFWQPLHDSAVLLLMKAKYTQTECCLTLSYIVLLKHNARLIQMLKNHNLYIKYILKWSTWF